MTTVTGRDSTISTAHEYALGEEPTTTSISPGSLFSPSADFEGSCGTVSARFVYVTPLLAQHWLDSANTHNRELRPRNIAKYQRDMLAGEWRMDGMPIRFAGDYEVLLDGQNRLTAQVAADLTLVHLVITGLTLLDQDTMDQSAQRSFSDALKLSGVKNAKAVASMVRGVWTYENFGIVVATGYHGNRTPSIPELKRTLEKHPSLPDYLVGSRPVNGLSATMVSTFWYLAAQVDPVDAAEFVRLLRTGERLVPGHPVHTLRERMAREARAPRHLPSAVRWVFLVRAWVAWRRGETLVKLQFKPGGAHPDRVPRIDDGELT